MTTSIILERFEHPSTAFLQAIISKNIYMIVPNDTARIVCIYCGSSNYATKLGSILVGYNANDFEPFYGSIRLSS